MASRFLTVYSQRVPMQMIGVLFAAYFGLREAIMALLKNRHDLDPGYNGGPTPLSWAAENGYEAVVKLLLDKSAELKSTDNEYGRTLLW
jgi:ankyrin repeat protein